MSETSTKSVLAPAIQAFASELPRSPRRNELISLASTLEHVTAPEQSSGWAIAMLRSLENDGEHTLLDSWMSRTIQESHVRGNRWSVLAYPVFAIGLAFCVFAFLGPIVVAPFEEIFKDFGIILPAPTVLLIFLTDQLLIHPARALGIVIITMIVMYFIARNIVRGTFIMGLVGWFFVGSNLNVSAMASFTGLLFDLLSAKVPLAESLELAGNGCGSGHLAESAKHLSLHLQNENTPLYDSRVANCFPRNLLDALQPPNDSQPNLAVLRELSAIYAERVIARTGSGNIAIGTLGVLAAGGVVVFVISGLFLPLINLISGLS